VLFTTSALEHINVDIIKMLKRQAKFWYQNRSNLLKANKNIGYKVYSKHKVDNFDHGEGKRSNFEQRQA